LLSADILALLLQPAFVDQLLWNVGFTLDSGRIHRRPARPFSADSVAKVEIRTAPKISQKLIFSRLRHGNTP
jgi:hypothetical protein